MRNLRFFVFAALLMAALAWLMPASLAAQNRSMPRKPLPYVLPDGTLAFVTVPDFQKSRELLKTWDMKKLYDLPEMQGFLKPIVDQINAQYDEVNEQLKSQTTFDIEQLLGLLAGQVSIAIIDVDASGIDPESLPNGPSPEMLKSAKILIAIDIDRSTETFGQALNWMQEELAGNAELKVTQHGGADITEVVSEDGSFFYSIYRQSMFVTLDLDTIKNTIDLYNNPSPSGTVGNSLKYRKVRQNLAASGELLGMYLDVETLFGKIRTAVPEDERENFDKALEISGVNGIKALGAQWVMRPNGMLQDNFFLYVPGVRKGIVQVLSNAPTSFTTLKFAPKTALSYTSFNFDLEMFWVEVLEAVRVASPEAYMDLQDNLEEQAQNGFDVSANLFGAVGGEMAAWSSVSADGPITQTWWITLKNAEGFAELMKNVVDTLAEEQPTMPLVAIDVAGTNAYQLDITENTRQSLEQLDQSDAPAFVREVLSTFIRKRSPGAMYFAIVRDAFIVTSSHSELQFIIQNPNGREDNLGENPAFQKAREGGFSTPSLFAWTDWHQVVDTAWPLLTEIVEGMKAEVANGNADLQEVPLDFNHFPKAEQVKAIFAPGADFEARNNLDGLLLRTRGYSVALAVAIVGGSLVVQQGGEMPQVPGGNGAPNNGNGPGNMPPRILPPGRPGEGGIGLGGNLGGGPDENEPKKENDGEGDGNK